MLSSRQPLANQESHRIVSTKRYLDGLLILLVLGIIGQTVLAVAPTQVASPPLLPSGSPMAIGDTLLEVAGYLRGGVPTTIRLVSDPGSVTVVYSFHPDCVHCHRIAPKWAEHFAADANHGAMVQRIAVTNDSTNAAYDYAKRFGWNVDVVSLRLSAPTDREYALVARTPWVFVFDSGGVLRFGGHGNALDKVGRIVADLSGSVDTLEGETVS